MLGISRRYSWGTVHDRTGLYDFFVRRARTQKSRTAVRRSLRLSVLVLSLLGINHRVTLEDASYERAGPRHGAGLLFFGVWGGARSRERAQQGVVMPLMTMATIYTTEDA